MTEVAVTDRCLGCVDIPGPFWVVAIVMGFPGGSHSTKSACNAEDLGLIPVSGRSPGEGNGNTFQYSCLENPMNGGAGWATVHGVQRAGHD